MLDLRASQSVGDDALVDRGLARRIRDDVLSICDRLLKAVSAARQQADSDELFWIEATKVEALFGLGRRADADRLKAKILSTESAGQPGSNLEGMWKDAALSSQLDKLAKLLPR